MTSTMFAAILQVAVVSSGANTYAEAHKANQESGQPMVVLVGAEWCPACRQMKNNIMPQVAKHGMLEKVAFAVVNTDQERRLARQLMSGGAIPQLIVYHKTADGWRRQSLVGAQSPATIESIISRALEESEAAPSSAETAAK